MLQQPKLIFSFNSYPVTQNRWHMGNKFYETIYMTSLSVLYACKWYSDVTLYVDEFAEPFFKDLPCKINIMEFEKNAEIWMKSKIKVIEKQTESFIHVDNDVFFKSKIDFIFSKTIVERSDPAKYNYNILLSFFEQYATELPFWSSDLKLIPSCGIVGFSDMNLKNTFVSTFKTYEKTFNKYRESYKLFMDDFWRAGNYPEVCLLLEQYSLGCILKHKKIEAKLLFSGESEADQLLNAKKHNYVHLYGSSKYNAKTKKRIHYILENEFANYYKNLTNRVVNTKSPIIRE